MKKIHDPKHESGQHAVGTGAGAAGGAVAGAVLGTAVGGPVGTVVGGAIGAATGAVAGHAAAVAVSPTVEDEYWKKHFKDRDYVERNHSYADYGPAYRYGWESRSRLGDRSFRDLESDLESGWDKARGESKLAWKQARHASRDAWNRLKGNGRHTTPERN